MRLDEDVLCTTTTMSFVISLHEILEFHYVAQVGLELTLLLPQDSSGLGYREYRRVTP